MGRHDIDLNGSRILITGAARGIGALTARRLHERGAKLALVGIEPELLETVAKECDASWHVCDVSDREQVDAAVAEAVAALGGLDVVIANAGIAAQLPVVGGDPEIFEKTIAVNTLGTYYVLRVAGEHISHPGGYALLTSSLAAVVHVPLLGAYSASKAAVVALADSLRAEIRPSGARVGVAYFAELDTDMTSRGFGTKAAKRTPLGGHGLGSVAPVGPAIDAIEAGIAGRSKRVVSPSWVRVVLKMGPVAQYVMERQMRRGLEETLRIAREEQAPLTTDQRDRP
jgi:NAD(P)-dependent dehydrogenase (short-subunit alcohol dehydrogenase family)